MLKRIDLKLFTNTYNYLVIVKKYHNGVNRGFIPFYNHFLIDAHYPYLACAANNTLLYGTVCHV